MNDVLAQNTSAYPIFDAVPREIASDTLINFGIFISLLLLALAKLYKPAIFAILGKMLINNNSLNQQVREHFNSLNISDFWLVLNFWWVSGLGCILFFNENNTSFWFPLFFGLIAHLFLILPLFLIAFISGCSVVKQENSFNLFFLPQLLGIIFLPLIVIGYLNPVYFDYIGWVILGLSSLLILFINFRGILFGLKHAIPLYYIILYICTLEILPALSFYYIITEK
jgi:hypothetical protein